MSKQENNYIRLDYDAIRNASMVLRALKQKHRQQILSLLQENKRMMVTDIYVKMRLEQSVISSFLGILRSAGVVKAEREGRTIYYSLNSDRIAAVSKFVEEMGKKEE